MFDTSFTSHNEQETIAYARSIAPLLKKQDVVCLYGDLGVGKTAFSRALIRSLIKQDIDVPSPTFTLVQTYEHTTPIWHFDLYRVEEADEIFEIGWEEAIAGSITIVEWPERLNNFLPSKRYDITISIENENVRFFDIQKIGFDQ